MRDRDARDSTWWTALVALFCVTTTSLVLTDSFAQLPGALLAFAAAAYLGLLCDK